MVTARLSAALVCVSSAVALAGPLGFAQATGYYKKDARPTLYQPLNLLDARDATAWCSTTSDPLNDALTFGLNGEMTVEEIRFSTGNGFNQTTWDQFARAHKIRITTGKQKKTIELEDKRGMQAVMLDPPLKGSRFTIEVLEAYPAEDPEAPTCLTDVVFVSETKALNGSWLTSKLKYDKSVAGVMGVWFAGFPTTPDRYLAFNFDGTFRYSYEPFDAKRNEPKVIEGTYDVTSSRLVFTVANKRYVVKYDKSAAPKGPAGSAVLTFEGELPEELKGPFRSTP